MNIQTLSHITAIIGILVPFTWLGKIIGLVPIPLPYMAVILIVPILYCIVALFAKKIEFIHPTTNELLTFELDLPNRYPFTIFK